MIMTRRGLLSAILLLTVLAGGWAPQARAWTVHEGDLTFCDFGPKFRVLEPKIENPKSSDHCTGTAKIQGVLWACADNGRNEQLVQDFRRRLNTQAERECQKHCSARQLGCEGHFLAPGRCGLQTDAEGAVALGKRMGCRKDCSGQVFSYCSLYDAGFRSEDPEKVSKQTPNCRCERVFP
jgi:hypothetical protein